MRVELLVIVPVTNKLHHSEGRRIANQNLFLTNVSNGNTLFSLSSYLSHNLNCFQEVADTDTSDENDDQVSHNTETTLHAQSEIRLSSRS